MLESIANKVDCRSVSRPVGNAIVDKVGYSDNHVKRDHGWIPDRNRDDHAS